jgi:hypothetical protein
MSCSLTGGFTIDCGRLVGGLRSVFISQEVAKDYEISTGGFLAATNNIITILDSSATINFYKFELKRELSSLTITQNHDSANGTTMVEQALSMTFQYENAVDHENLANVAYGPRTVFVLTSNDVLYGLGISNGMETSTMTTETGTSYGDFSGSRLEMTGRERLTYFGTVAPTYPAVEAITGMTGAAVV